MKYTSIVYKFLFLVIIAFGSVSCSFKKVRLNDPKDNQDGLNFVSKFYKAVSDHSFSEINKFRTDSLKKFTGENGLTSLLKTINIKAGSFQKFEEVAHYNMAIDDGKPVVLYNYKIKVTYDKGVVLETIGLRKADGKPILLNSYHANSDLLVK